MHRDKLFNLLTSSAWKRDWAITLFLKLGLGIFLPFFADEAYYWTWAKNLKLSFFDHPPFSAWLFWISQPLDSFFFASRLLFVVLSHVTLWIWCDFLAVELSDRNKRAFFWILLLHPLLGLGGLIANPDIPFLFFWSLSLVFYLRSLENPESSRWPTLLGISLGLGFVSKYLMGLISVVFVLHLLVSQSWKKIRPHHIWLPVILGFIFSLPVWIWNFQNDWSSLRFQIDHGLGQKVWKPQWTLDFLLGTLILLFPPFVYSHFKRIGTSVRTLHGVLFLGLLLFFTYTTFRGDTELNWPLALYPSFFLLVVPIVAWRWSYWIYSIFFAGLSTLLLAFIFFNPAPFPHPRLQEGAFYKSLFEETKSYRPLYTSTYQAASYFWFLSKEPFYKLRFASRPDEFDKLSGSQPLEDSFFFLKEGYQTIPPSQLEIFSFEKAADLKFGFEVYKATRKK
ncbi:MAG: ArnT family glycosyltransferase [Bdellovibrionales bacterium]